MPSTSPEPGWNINNIVGLGGLSLKTNMSGTFVQDDEMPFTSQATSIVRNSAAGSALVDPLEDLEVFQESIPLLFQHYPLLLQHLAGSVPG